MKKAGRLPAAKKPLMRVNQPISRPTHQPEALLRKRQEPASPSKTLGRVSSLPTLPESKPAYVKPGVTLTHRLSLDGNIGAALYAPTELQPSVANSSRELLQFVRAQQESKKHVTEPPMRKVDEARRIANSPPSRQHKTMMASLSTPVLSGLQRNIAKFSFRTRTGCINGVPKPQNQDSYLVVNDFACKNQTLMGVYDGHGSSGHEVSGFVKKVLPAHLESGLPPQLLNNFLPLEQEEPMVRQAFVSAYLGLNSDLRKRQNIDSEFSGTTAVSVLLRGSYAFGANAGDSRAILGKKIDSQWSAVPLSQDHKPDDPIECARIEKAGGRVEPFRGIAYLDESGEAQGPARVWMRHEQIPGLAMSRSVGDFVASQLGVVAEPEVIAVPLTKDHKFLVLASDGVWEFISSQAVSIIQCVEMIAPLWEVGNIEGACDRILKESIACWKRVSATQEDEVIDDITLILVFLAI